MKRFRFSNVLCCALPLSLILAMTASFNVHAGDERTSEVRSLASYSVIVLRVPVDATFVVAPRSSITITGPADVLPLVTTAIQDGQLIVDVKRSVTLAAPLTVRITGPSIQGASLEGSGSIKLEHPQKTALGLQITGSGSIVATGNATTLSIDVTGAGDVDSSAVNAQKADVSVSGKGTVRTRASEQAVIDVSGVGDVHVSGHPSQREVNHSGVATVTFD